jgi:hypothetical protein
MNEKFLKELFSNACPVSAPEWQKVFPSKRVFVIQSHCISYSVLVQYDDDDNWQVLSWKEV